MTADSRERWPQSTGASTRQHPVRPRRREPFSRCPSETGEAVHAVSVDVSLEASPLNIPIPPLTVLTHHPERIEERHHDGAVCIRPGDERLRQRQRDHHRHPRRRHHDGPPPSTAYAYVPRARQDDRQGT